MDTLNSLILAGSLVFLASLVVSSIASRFGAPLLLVFLALGMLAGEDGPGKIVFSNYQLSYVVGTIALVVILFDGGLRTRQDSFRISLKPAGVLATLGVLITTGVTGLFAAWVLNLSWLEGLLIGAIVGSTDAAAVFALLSGRGLEINRRVGSALEIESGSNDPMAVFLTSALIGVLGQQGQDAGVAAMLWLFVKQMGLGALAGWAGGKAMVWLFQRLGPRGAMLALFSLGTAGALFSLTTAAGGSGFLAIYLAGIVVGNARVADLPNLLNIHDGYAWLAQVTMFLVLGLLVTPSNLLPVAPYALAISIVLMLVARPLAVWLCMLPFPVPKAEKLFMSWVGLRGAVPVILAIFPLMAGLPNSQLFFNVAFFVVMMSLLFQGWTIAPLAERLKLKLPARPDVEHRVPVVSGQEARYEAASCQVSADSPAEGQLVGELALPSGVRLAALYRDEQALEPTASQTLRAGDWACLIGPGPALETAGEAFHPPGEDPYYGYFTVSGLARLADLADSYGLNLSDRDRADSIADYCKRACGYPLVAGDVLRLDRLEMVIRAAADGQVKSVGLRYLKSQ